jgi:modification target Cys-rich repeat protein
MALATLAGCPKGKLPGGGGMPGGGVPGGLGGESGMVDPNSCGNYAASDAGRKLKDFLVATQQLQTTTENTVKVVRESCIILGKEIGMIEADLNGETKDVCAKVYGQVDANMKVAFKGKAALKVKYTPAVCKVNVEAEAKAAAECEGKASADIKASCSGTCSGTCEGTCAGKAGTGGSGGQCNGQCQGTCRGECDGHADVNASAQCKASASVKASADVQCTEPSLEITADAKLVVDKTKAEQTINGLKAGLPKIFSVKARLASLEYAAKVWASSAAELKSSAGTLATSFKDQAMCISGQIAAAAKMMGSIQANVSVSVEVSASASGSIGG